MPGHGEGGGGGGGGGGAGGVIHAAAAGAVAAAVPAAAGGAGGGGRGSTSHERKSKDDSKKPVLEMPIPKYDEVYVKPKTVYKVFDESIESVVIALFVLAFRASRELPSTSLFSTWRCVCCDRRCSCPTPCLRSSRGTN